MSALSAFVQMVKNITREYYETETISNESMNMLYNEFMALPSCDKRMVVEEVFKDYLNCHKPILNDKLKVRLELINRKKNMEMRTYMFNMFSTIFLGTLTAIFIVILVVDIGTGGENIYKILKNVIFVVNTLGGN